MSNKLFIFPAVILMICMLLAGCSGNSIPTSPGEINGTSADLTPSVVSDFDSDGNPSAGYGVLGLYEVSVDTVRMTSDLTPFRTIALTDVLEVVDITNFLESSPCLDCIAIGSISIDVDGNLVVSMGIKHPFDAGIPSEPITGKNRGDLHVFNVEGLIVSQSTTVSNFGGLNEQVAELKLANADGYSPYLDSVIDAIYETNATIHPYKLHFDDYSTGNFSASNAMGFESVTDPGPSGNLVMAMGCDYDYQDYAFDLGLGNTVNFVFAVGCTYAVSSASKGERFTPEYRVPQHLKKAACEIQVRITDNQLEGGQTASSADLEIDVVDINHGVAVGEALNEMFADSSVSGISLEIPGVLNSFVTVLLTNIGGTGHDATDPLTYAITIQNEASAVDGTYRGLVKVVDSYAPGLNTCTLLDSMDGIERVDATESPLEGLFAISEFATYQVFDIEVGGGGSTTCPDAPFNGYTISQDPAFGSFNNFTDVPDWSTSNAFPIIDADFLSTGDGVCIYGKNQGGFDDNPGELRRYDPTSSPWAALASEYPGEMGVSMDVDSTDLVVFVTAGTTTFTANTSEFTLSERINASNNYFTVVDAFSTNPLSDEVEITVGTPIMAIDIDAYDNIWVLDRNNIMHMYEKQTSPLGYTENVSRQFDLEVTTGGAFNNLVLAYDFVIDFHNEAFFILTNVGPRCEVWRIECDGEYIYPFNTNANPMQNVLPQDTLGIADIGIDNLDASGNVLAGAQDSQIIVSGGIYTGPFFETIFARIDSELGQLRTVDNNEGDGLTCVFIDQRADVIWGWHRGAYAGNWTEDWTAPSEWQ